MSFELALAIQDDWICIADDDDSERFTKHLDSIRALLATCGGDDQNIIVQSLSKIELVIPWPSAETFRHREVVGKLKLVHAEAIKLRRVLEADGLDNESSFGCYDLISRLASAVYHVVANAYQAIDASVELDLDLIVKRSKEAKLLDILGFCDVERVSRGSQNARIELGIDFDRLNWLSLGRMAYVLQHELMCHAWQDLNSGEVVSVRENAPSCCMWTEGWMDRLAVRMLIASAEDPNTSIAQAAQAFKMPSLTMLQQVLVAHESRFEASQRGITDLTIRQRRAARAACDLLLDRWTKERGSRSRALDHLAAFSLACNLWRMERREREDFAHKLTWLLLMMPHADDHTGIDNAFHLDDLYGSIVDVVRGQQGSVEVLCGRVESVYQHLSTTS